MGDLMGPILDAELVDDEPQCPECGGAGGCSCCGCSTCGELGLE